MEIIDNYLNALFAQYPLTPRTEEAKADLRSMMEDSYNGAIAAGHSPNEALGQAIYQFGNLDEVAPLLGLGQQGQQDTPGPRLHTVSIIQASNYADACRRTRWLLGSSVALFVVSPILLVSLALLSSSPSSPISEPVAIVIGFLLLVPMVAAGVGMLVWRGQILKPFQRITDRSFTPTPELEAWAAALRDQHSWKRTRALIIAIALWILSLLPIISAGVLTSGWHQDLADPYLGLGLGATLLLVAGGLLVFLPANWAHAAAAALSESGSASSVTDARMEQDHTDEDRFPTAARAFFASYWLIITGIYLTWSFVWSAWDISWILWPIAGVAFAAIAAILGTMYPERPNPRR